MNRDLMITGEVVNRDSMITGGLEARPERDVGTKVACRRPDSKRDLDAPRKAAVVSPKFVWRTFVCAISNNMEA